MRTHRRVRAHGRVALFALSAFALHSGISTVWSIASSPYASNPDHPFQFVGLAVLGAAALTFLRWVHSVHALAKEQSPSSVRFSSGWAVAGFAIPYLNLVRPYQVMSDLWKAFIGPGASRVRAWWISTIVPLALLAVLSRVLGPEHRPYLRTFAGVVITAICIQAMFLVRAINRAVGEGRSIDVE